MSNTIKKTAAIYIRVSTNDQTELSPDAQKRLLNEYANAHNIQILYEFYDDGISGKSINKRTGFNIMIATAKQKPKPFDIILVHKFSRFARSQDDSIIYKNLLRKQYDIDVVSISEPIIEGPYGTLIERIIEWMDEFYSINLADEVRKGMVQKALKGEYQSRTPLGYKIEHSGAIPVIVPDEAKIVQKIFNMYVNENKSTYEIAKQLNLLNLKTSQGNKFERRSIEYILNNPIYIGYIRWNRKENATNKIRDKSKWIISKSSIEPIISEELFNAASKRTKLEFKAKNSRPNITQKHFLSGVLKCSNCGKTLVSSSRNYKKNIYYYFQCYGYSKGKCQISHQVSENIVLGALDNSLQEIFQNQEIEFEIKILSNNLDLDNTLNILNSNLKKIAEKEKKIKDAYINGIDTLEEYSINKNSLLLERNSLNEKILFFKNTNKEQKNKEVVQKIKSVYDIIHSDKYDYIQKGNVLKSIIEKIIYNKNLQTFEFYYYFYKSL